MSRKVLGVVALVALLCTTETAVRLGADSPFLKYTRPTYGMGYFWDTPRGWEAFLDRVPINRDGLGFVAIAGFLRDDPSLSWQMAANPYTRLAGYSLVGVSLTPLLPQYASFVVVNALAWIAGALATYALAVRRTRSELVGVAAAALAATAPAFSALVGQPLPYVASYGLFAVGLWYCERVRLFSRVTPRSTVGLAGLVVGTTLLFYDLYMLPAFVVFYGLRRMPLQRLALFLAGAAVPRAAWSVYWRAFDLPSSSLNSNQPVQALQGWLAGLRGGSLQDLVLSYGALGAHVLLNVAAVFLLLPLLLAAWELVHRLRAPDADWYLALLLAGFAPAAFMVSIWPHIPRWYAYGYPAVYILCAAGAVRIACAVARTSRPWLSPALATALVLLPLVVLANADLLGYSKPLELLLFQPERWSYLWSR